MRRGENVGIGLDSQPRQVWTWLAIAVAAVLASGALIYVLLARVGQSQPAAGPSAPYATLINAGNELLRRGDNSAAAQMFRQAIAENASDPVGYFDLGVVYQREGDDPAALKAYNDALRANSDYAPALFNEAVIYSANSPMVAMFYYRQVIAMQPNSPTAYLNLGLLELASPGLQSQAHRDLARAVQLDPSLKSRIPAGG